MIVALRRRPVLYLIRTVVITGMTLLVSLWVQGGDRAAPVVDLSEADHVITHALDNPQPQGTTVDPIGIDGALAECAVSATPAMATPIGGATVSSEFGRRRDPFKPHTAFHGGMDFAVPQRTPVHASAAGVVVRAGWHKAFGNMVVIDHGHGLKTLYAHNRKVKVRRGQAVARMQRIADSGSTGRSTGPHLHFEVHLHGKRVNPRHYLATHWHWPEPVAADLAHTVGAIAIDGQSTCRPIAVRTT